MSELARWFDTRRSPFEMIERLIQSSAVTSDIRVEEVIEGNALVVRAELPGIDPERDVDVSIADDALHIRAHREEKSELKESGTYRSEFRYGSFSRRLPLPEGTTAEEVSATYRDGVLEVRMPLPAQKAAPASQKVEVKRG